MTFTINIERGIISPIIFYTSGPSPHIMSLIIPQIMQDVGGWALFLFPSPLGHINKRNKFKSEEKLLHFDERCKYVFSYNNRQWWIMHSKPVEAGYDFTLISCVQGTTYSHSEDDCCGHCRKSSCVEGGRMRQASVYCLFLLLSVCIYMWKTFSLTPHVCRWESSGCLLRTDVCGANVFRSMRKCSSSIQTHPATSWTRQPVHWAQSSSAIQ